MSSLFSERNPIIHYQGNSIDVELLLRKHKITEKIGKIPFSSGCYQKSMNTFPPFSCHFPVGCLRRTFCSKPKPELVQTGPTILLILRRKAENHRAFMRMHNESIKGENGKFSQFSILFRRLQHAESLELSRSIRTCCRLALAPFSEKKLE